MFSRNIWYFAHPGETLKSGEMVHKVLLGEPVLIGRDSHGKVYALRDICPHRGVPLSAGKFLAQGKGCDHDAVECPYHGWKFRTTGECTDIPSLVPEQEMDVERIKVRSYPTQEIQGNVWIFMTDEKTPLATPPEGPPVMPIENTLRPGLRETMSFDCHVDHAVVGLMDPAHGPFVHQSWFWRSSASIHEKAKDFAPSPLGFTMVAHTPSSNSLAYKILGGTPTTEISFQLPGIRIEKISVRNRRVVGLTTVTPIDETHTEITQSFYWNMPLLSLLKPIVQPFIKVFLKQDRDMVNLQQEGLKFNPRLMLINDSDVQAKWYLRLKKEWQAAQDENREFVNPVKPVTLKWRS